MLLSSEPTYIIDTNECLIGDDSCPDGSQCVNIDGGYTCLCATGYAYNPTQNLCSGSLYLLYTLIHACCCWEYPVIW